MAEDQFTETQAAYAKVKETIQALRADYDSTCAEIEQTEAELEALPLAPVPLEDMKAAILQFIEASGQRYADRHVRKAISTFATGSMGGLGVDAGLIGKPLRFLDIEAAIGNENTVSGRAQFATYALQEFDDGALYFFFGDLVREGLRRIMDEMAPQEFGYGAIHPGKVGSGLSERRSAIAATAARLEELREKRGDLAAKLLALGHHIAPTLKR